MLILAPILIIAMGVFLFFGGLEAIGLTRRGVRYVGWTYVGGGVGWFLIYSGIMSVLGGILLLFE